MMHQIAPKEQQIKRFTLKKKNREEEKNWGTKEASQTNKTISHGPTYV